MGGPRHGVIPEFSFLTSARVKPNGVGIGTMETAMQSTEQCCWWYPGDGAGYQSFGLMPQCSPMDWAVGHARCPWGLPQAKGILGWVPFPLQGLFYEMEPGSLSLQVGLAEPQGSWMGVLLKFH